MKNTTNLQDKLLSSTSERKSASEVTQIKNTAEAYRAGVVSAYSTERQHASCGCCVNSVPEIAGVWDQSQYQFLKNTYDIGGDHLRVHPTLWNNGTNNILSGVFEVLPGKIYQVRGYDMANITFVKTNNIGKTEFSTDDHWMVMDTLMSKECTEAALNLFSDYLKGKVSGYSLKGSIVGMIISHSHVDHYGGMSVVKEWFISETEESEEVTPSDEAGITEVALPFILAPEGFVEHSVSENVYVGNAMGRRASYQYGSFIKPSYTDGGSNEASDYLSGEISIGIGQGQSTGSISFELPTKEIGENCSLMLDELTVEFQLTPGTEAPAEMNNYFPDYHALWLAENCSGTLHNLYTLRGAQVRDGKAWAGYLMETVALYGDDVQVIFQSHNWPHWGTAVKFSTGDKSTPTDLKAFLIETAAIYKYINDQTLLYMNMGYKMNEASDLLTLPRAMQKNWCLKPFYGTPKHNAKAVYQKYLGWYDANPLHLEELPPELLAKEQLRYFTSGANIIDTIKSDIGKGNYWIAAYMAHQIVLGSSNESEVSTAKLLCADAMEQLGYQCESGTWRNAYLAAAYELRNGKGRVSANGGNMSNNMSAEMLLDYISILFDGELGATLSYDAYLKVKTDENTTENFIFAVRNGAILYYPVEDVSKENAIEISKTDLLAILGGSYTGSCEIFTSISKCLVDLTLDRYKYFDIIGRHDSEVKIKDQIYNIPDVAKSCFYFLEKLAVNFYNSPSKIAIEGNEAKEWFDYCNILGNATGLLSADDFFGTVGSSECNDQKGEYSKEFTEYELYYDLYRLLRYYAAPYLKNDTGDFPASLKADTSAIERYYKLKKKIRFLETLVPDFYLGTDDTYAEIDDNENAEWEYLTHNQLTNKRFDITYFFWSLFSGYHTLVRTLGLMGTYIRFKYTESAEKVILAYNFPENETFYVYYDEEEIKVNGSGELSISKECLENGEYLRVIATKDGAEVDSLTWFAPYFKTISEGWVASIKFKEIMQGSDEFLNVKFIDFDAIPQNIMPYNAPPIFPNDGGNDDGNDGGSDGDSDGGNDGGDDTPAGKNYQLTYTTKYVNALVVAGCEDKQTKVELPSGTLSFPQEGETAEIKAYSDCGFYVSKTFALS